MNKKKTFLFSFLIILASVIVTFIVFQTEPTAEREGATKKTAMLVDVAQVARDDYRPTVLATGNVQPAKDITLSPRVGGEIIRISESFIPGSFVKKGEMLIQIDPSDYRNTLQLRESDLELARADLRVEMGRQDVARKDFELVGGEDMSPENKALVLREPQLESAKANVKAAEAAVRQAELNFQRTTIRAPFDAHIISRNVNVGSQVNVNTNLGRLVGMDEYWVVANVPVSKVNYLSFSGDDGDGSEVKITNNAWTGGQQRTGELFRLVGALDNQTRLARVIVKVQDPLSHELDMTENPPLMIGTFVETHIQARTIPDVIRLNRDYLRKDGQVWIMEEGKLRIRDVTIAFEDSKFAYITGGLQDKDRVVTTNLSTVVDGSDLRLEGADSDSTQQSAAQQ